MGGKEKSDLQKAHRKWRCENKAGPTSSRQVNTGSKVGHVGTFRRRRSMRGFVPIGRACIWACATAKVTWGRLLHFTEGRHIGAMVRFYRIYSQKRDIP